VAIGDAPRGNPLDGFRQVPDDSPLILDGGQGGGGSRDKQQNLAFPNARILEEPAVSRLISITSVFRRCGERQLAL
jgi:hypothetical protein